MGVSGLWVSVNTKGRRQGNILGQDYRIGKALDIESAFSVKPAENVHNPYHHVEGISSHLDMQKSVPPWMIQRPWRTVDHHEDPEVELEDGSKEGKRDNSG